jgi:hemerythrin superfamily protein
MPNATQLLRQDHKKVEVLFNKYEQGKNMDAKKRFAMQAMNELEVHAQVEEEIFYPAVKKGIEESELVDEAVQEHQEAKSLIAELKKMQGRDDGAADEFESKFSNLMEAIQHHVEEEEGEMFPKVEDSELDLAELGSEMADRKKELMQEMASRRHNPDPEPRAKPNPKASRRPGVRNRDPARRVRALAASERERARQLAQQAGS